MHRRRLGALEVSAIGLGCVQMSLSREPDAEAQSIHTVHRALDLGVTLIDTADLYGLGHNERLISRAIARRRADIVVATKVGAQNQLGEDRSPDGRPDYIRAACDASLSRLGVDTIDLYYLHRADPLVPIEETVGAMAALVEAGKVRFIGLSGVDGATVRRAHAVHPITAVQNEYAVWTRDAETEVLPALREMGIGFVAYSPLGRGFLSGLVRTAADVESDAWLGSHPRFTEASLDDNIAAVDRLCAIAERVGASAAQLAIAWVLAQGNDIVPIPGTAIPSQLAENVAAADLSLDAAVVAEIEAAVALVGSEADETTRR